MRRLGLLLLALCVCGPATGDDRIVVGSKNFAENRLLAEMFARLLVQIYAAINPCITLLDGILALEGQGPGRSGTPRQHGSSAH